MHNAAELRLHDMIISFKQLIYHHGAAFAQCN